MEKENNQLKDIKKLYNQCEVWVNSHDSSKFAAFSFVNLKDTFHWFKEMSELSDGDKNILFGDTLLTIEDIKERILKHLKELRLRFKEEDSSDYNDEDGHASLRGYKSVVEFFESLDEEKLMSIANGSVQYYYEVDIDGGRSYLMSGSNIYLYIFNYLYYTKKLMVTSVNDFVNLYFGRI
jgi:hypothetical protein